MRRSKLLTLGGIGYTVVLALAALVIALGAAGVLMRLAAAAGALPAKLAAIAKALPGLSATVGADPSTGTVSSISITA